MNNVNKILKNAAIEVKKTVLDYPHDGGKLIAAMDLFNEISKQIEMSLKFSQIKE